MPINTIWPTRIILYFEVCYHIRSDGLAVESSIKDSVAAHGQIPTGLYLSTWPFCLLAPDGQTDSNIC